MKTYPLFKVHVPVASALRAIAEVFDSGFINEGLQVTSLSRGLQARLGAEGLVLTNSCTSALTMALKLAGVGPGDEVISTPMTCVATNTPILNLGAKVVWADVDPDSGMIDPVDVFRKLTPQTKAVMAVAWAGNPPDLDGLNAACSNDFGVPLILDAAHAFGAAYHSEPVHRHADFTCYSFQAIKHFTTGDGGALVCRDEEDHQRAKAMKWFGLDRDKAKDEKGEWKGQQWDAENDIEEAGYKFNMNNVAAAIGLSQLPHIDRVLAAHRSNAALYDELLVGCPIAPAKRHLEGTSSSWVYTVLVDPTCARMTRDQLLIELNARGVKAGVVHVPNDGYACFRESRIDLPGVRAFSERQFSLPCGWWLDGADVGEVVRVLKEVVQ